jgi:hypothetical protein
MISIENIDKMEISNIFEKIFSSQSDIVVTLGVYNKFILNVDSNL